MDIYAVTVTASITPVDVPMTNASVTAFCVADMTEAEELGVRFAIQRWPLSKGWTNHQAQAVLLDETWLAQCSYVRVGSSPQRMHSALYTVATVLRSRHQEGWEERLLAIVERAMKGDTT